MHNHAWGGMGTQLWVTCHVPPKRPYFFFARFHQKTPILPTSTQRSPIFKRNSLSPKNPDTSLSLKDPPFSHLIVKQVPIFGKKLDFSKILTNLTKCWEIFRPFWPWKPLFFDAFHWKTPYMYFCALCHWKTPFFDAICHRKTPTSEVLGGTCT